MAVTRGCPNSLDATSVQGCGGRHSGMGSFGGLGSLIGMGIVLVVQYTHNSLGGLGSLCGLGSLGVLGSLGGLGITNSRGTFQRNIDACLISSFWFNETQLIFFRLSRAAKIF